MKDRTPAWEMTVDDLIAMFEEKRKEHLKKPPPHNVPPYWTRLSYEQVFTLTDAAPDGDPVADALIKARKDAAKGGFQTIRAPIKAVTYLYPFTQKKSAPAPAKKTKSPKEG